MRLFWMSWRRCVAYLPGLLILCGVPIVQALAFESHVLTHQGVERRFELHIPARATETSRPLVLALHGNGQSIGSLRHYLRLAPVADREGFIIAYPEAVARSWSYGRPVLANMPAVDGQTVDDIGFLDALVARLVRENRANPERIYVTGSSRGGLMTFTLACAMADRFAAFAPLITSMTEYQVADCTPARAPPMLVLAGTADLIQRYDGWIWPRGRLLSVPETMEFWRLKHGCVLQHAQPLPRRHPDDGTLGIGVVRWLGCSSGAPLVLYRVFGGSHSLPSFAPTRPPQKGRRAELRNRDAETAEIIWAFFKDLTLSP